MELDRSEIRDRQNLGIINFEEAIKYEVGFVK